MKQVYFPSLIFILIFSSCGNPNEEKAIVTVEKEIVQTLPIRDFIKKFHTIQFPFYFKGWTEEVIDKSKLFSLDKNSPDSLFFDIKDDEADALASF